MRKGPVALMILMIMVLGIPAFLSENVSGSGAQAATFDRIEISADPSIQGFGGEMKVTVTAYFYGGCCYSLFANDIVPELTIPDGLNISSGPTPESRGELTALAGGEPTTCSFTWIISCDNKGSYQLQASVDTSDCGSRDEEYEVHVIKGATISSPEVYPIKTMDDGTKIVPTSDDIFMKFSASYAVGDIDVVSASVYFLGSSEDLLGEDISASGDTLYKDEKEFGKGDRVDCEADDLDEDLFHVSVPKSKDPYLYYWIEVIDEKDETTTSSIYQLNVEDVDAVSRWNMISIIFLVLTMIGLIAVLYVGQKILKKRMDGVESDDKFSVLGPVGRKRYLTDTEKIPVIPEKNWKYAIVGIVIVLMIMLTVVMVLTGYAGDLFDQLLNPSGGCWSW